MAAFDASTQPSSHLAGWLDRQFGGPDFSRSAGHDHLGGQIHVRWGWQANFFLMAALSACLFGVAWRGLAASHRQSRQTHWQADLLSACARLARESRFWLYVLLLASTTATFYVFLAGAPIVLRGYGVGPDNVGFFIMCVPLSYIQGNFMTSRLILRLGEGRMMALGQALWAWFQVWPARRWRWRA